MRKIDIRDYHYEVIDSEGKSKEFPYSVKSNLIAVLFQRQLNLSAIELLGRDDLARKIRDCESDEILLEESEYEEIKKAVNAFRGYGKQDIEFVKRVLECPKIEVEEKK
ncbi:hypothetical protein ES708_10725 [subsurface metagenome]